VVVADKPSMEVERNPAGPDVATRFRRAVRHDNGGVSYSVAAQVEFIGLRVRCSPTQPNMEASETIQCPYCSQSFDLRIDTSTPTQHFTTDCEVCCRPFEVLVECEPGEVLNLEVRGA
jgi:uncharacterized Zn-finger protein